MNGNCELCGCECDLTKHHLIPQKVSRSAKYGKELKTEESNFLWICTECHSQIHALYSEQELRDFYYTRELLLSSDKLGKFIKWKVKHPTFNGSSKMSNHRKRH